MFTSVFVFVLFLLPGWDIIHGNHPKGFAFVVVFVILYLFVFVSVIVFAYVFVFVLFLLSGWDIIHIPPDHLFKPQADDVMMT